MVVSLIDSGELEIDSEGRIWRNAMKKGLKKGGYQIVKVKRKRAEFKLPLGYLQVRIMMNGKRYYVGAHRLVWQYFKGDIPDGLQVNHKNGIKHDNRIKNLEVVTRSENMKHSYKLGLHNQHGERNHQCKIADKQVVEIRNLYATGDYTLMEVADLYGIAFQTVSVYVNGKSRIKSGGTLSKNNPRGMPDRDPLTGRFTSD